MYFRDKVAYEPLPLPDRVRLPDAEALAAAEAFRDYMARRHSVRDFAPDPVPLSVIEACVAAAGTAPSGANHQPWHFVAIGDPAMKAQIRAAAEADGIVATFQALLQIAQIEGGSPRARFSPVDLGPLAQTMTELYEPAATETGHALTLTLRNPATISGERTLLGQVVANLIENALRHSPPGPVALTIDGATITVADRGPGIPAAERDTVLRRLYRLETSRSTPGSGLGLALVDAIVKLHGGTLTLADNAPGLRVSVAFANEVG